MSRPTLLDLYCGAGGAAVGYHRAGFDVTGVDYLPQPRFPFRFIQADALEYIAAHGHEYDAIHASPPCQAYSRLRHLTWLRGREYPDLVGATRVALLSTGRPWIIENVQGAPLIGITLCGMMFALGVYRHRIFESSHLILGLPHTKHTYTIKLPGNRINNYRRDGEVVTVAGHQCSKASASRAMGINWMTSDELSQAIPPAYTEFVGTQIISILR